MELTSPGYWESYWSAATGGARPPRGFAYFGEIAPFLPPGGGKAFLEIGCAPGQILAEFCVCLGYEAHGVEYAADPEQVEGYLRDEGVRVGKIHKADFITWEAGRTYDVVASFGFIEHFDDPAGIVDRHFALAEPGGTVVITLPNFARGQKVLNWLFNKDLLAYHNTRCMSRRFLLDCARRNSAEVLVCKYVGGHFDFRVRPARRSWLMERMAWRTRAVGKWLDARLGPGSNPWFSPYLVAVFRTSVADRNRAKDQGR
jgi:SAM-dependent methyltransferase